MQTQALNPRQRRFLRLYLGRDDRYNGNASKCYKVVYDPDEERSAKVGHSMASKLLKHPIIKEEIERWHDVQRKQTMADATFVLEQSVRLYDRAMGDAPIEVDVIEEDKETGKQRVVTLEKREYQPAIARQALELIGRHTSVQAFQDNVEHTHTHKLEQALARRSKLVEARATNAIPVDRALPDPDVIEGKAHVVEEDQGAA